MDRWRLDYNHHRIHTALGYQTPAAYATEIYGLLEPEFEIDFLTKHLSVSWFGIARRK